MRLAKGPCRVDWTDHNSPNVLRLVGHLEQHCAADERERNEHLRDELIQRLMIPGQVNTFKSMVLEVRSMKYDVYLDGMSQPANQQSQSRSRSVYLLGIKRCYTFFTVVSDRVYLHNVVRCLCNRQTDTASVRGLDTVVITNSIVRGRISDYILIASRRYD